MMVARPFRPEQNDSLVSLKSPRHLPILELPQEATSALPERPPGPTYSQCADALSLPSHPPDPNTSVLLRNPDRPRPPSLTDTPIPSVGLTLTPAGSPSLLCGE